jgi:bleomycin hydrolase
MTASQNTATTSPALGHDALDSFSKQFRAEPRYRLAMNAVTKTSLHSVAQNREAAVAANHVFSHTVKAGLATAQKSSGRCWLFAGLNPMRVAAMEAMNLENFELSQNYPMFWDKLEKANYFLESILQTLNEPVDGRLLMWLLQAPIQDGGQWHMFVNIVRKYGVVPKSVMPETESSGNTGLMNAHITAALRDYACRLREQASAGAPLEALRAAKTEYLAQVYRMLAIHLGEPPQEFLWQWRDKDNKFTRDGLLTPQQFRERRVPYDLDSKVCLIHAPTADKPFNRTYTIDYLGNVVEGEIIRYLNVEIDVLKKATLDSILAGDAVWFGCDCGKMLDRDLGVWDTDLYDYALVYGSTCKLNKAERLDYGHSAMNHAMVFTGVDVDDRGAPTKWRVENSWGDDKADKGFYVMTDRWFDEYVYEVAVDRARVPAEALAALDEEPIHLPPWDPMGALAR